jgi:hypothetical protein
MLEPVPVLGPDPEPLELMALHLTLDVALLLALESAPMLL